MNWAIALALPLAWGLDAAFGEPRNRFHPVAWLGLLLGPMGHRFSTWSPAAAFVAGAIAWLVIATALGAAAWWVQLSLLNHSPGWVALLLLGLLLKPCFAWRMLRDEVAAVENALMRGGLNPARQRLSRLVSRDVNDFGDVQIRETAIETLAENLNDSVIAPLAWFAVAGLPGAVVYRFANTADAMWGYRGRYEWAGKWAARADDLLSWWPARLTAVLLWPTLVPAAWRALRTEAARTPSPNGGWAMGAMAMRLNVRLGKTGIYLLHPAGAVPGESHVVQALDVAGRAAVTAAAGATLLWCARSLWS
ncbi:MAG TPA: adenosylcobinamide-phosphate synthase CbiB [Ideonella sp.]|uniref:adenosylcobinamide-phosphate synthase CbiB n=1 Tax=Ideonella sp. TaxID=1929293 RepID=UPI002E33B299|nr:adenosylcobinamide-phosphate synthase CbiB [Ideonella sp.]HEX5686846.1 adenosylcobinamide-phosphate synthase CbiB [Ideonella sp.]